MIPQTPWLGHVFHFEFPLGHFPMILDRFRGTPARIEYLVQSIEPSILTARVNNAWSIQEHIGHLLDLSDLDERRLKEFLSGVPTLTAADPQNRKTHEANHNARRVKDLVRMFRRTRQDLVTALERLSEEQIARTAIHPRLKQSLRLVDWVYFMAEHDDHHLARMASLARTLARKT